MSLVGVELRRLFARRAVVVLLAVSVLGTVVVTSIALWQYRPPSDADLQRAEQLVQADTERCIARADSERQEERCEHQSRVGWYLDRSTLRPVALFEDLSTGLTLVLGFTALLIGTTFVGAEFTSGAIVPLLLVRPRREVVWAAKLVATGLAVGAVALLAWACAVGLLLLAAYGWAPDDPSSDAVRALLLQALRAAAVTTGAAVVGAAVTAATRSTMAGLGTVIGYALVAEVVGRLTVPLVQPWLLSNHVFGTVLGRWVVRDYSDCGIGGGRPDCPREVTFSLVSSGLVLAAVGAVLLAVSLAVFKRQDIA